MLTKAEVMSTQLAQRQPLGTTLPQCGGIRDLSALLASISSFVRFLAFARLCHFESDPLRENLHSSPRAEVPFA